MWWRLSLPPLPCPPYFDYSSVSLTLSVSVSLSLSHSLLPRILLLPNFVGKLFAVAYVRPPRVDTSPRTHVPPNSYTFRIGRRRTRLIGSYPDPATGQQWCPVRTCPTAPEKLWSPSSERFGATTANGRVSTDDRCFSEK